MKKVTTKALIGRINRKLSNRDERLHKSRENTSLYWNAGEYYVVDVRYNTVVDLNVDIADLGRELGVMHDGEAVA